MEMIEKGDNDIKLIWQQTKLMKTDNLQHFCLWIERTKAIYQREGLELL
jgi:hypothetical protein